MERDHCYSLYQLCTGGGFFVWKMSRSIDIARFRKIEYGQRAKALLNGVKMLDSILRIDFLQVSNHIITQMLFRRTWNHVTDGLIVAS